jgi:hypothetical protein
VRKYLEYLLETRGVMGKMMNENELHALLSIQLKEEIIFVSNLFISFFDFSLRKDDKIT